MAMTPEDLIAHLAKMAAYRAEQREHTERIDLMLSAQAQIRASAAQPCGREAQPVPPGTEAWALHVRDCRECLLSTQCVVGQELLDAMRAAAAED